MKTKEELNALREEVEALNIKLAELSEDELLQISGGTEVEDALREYQEKLQHSIEGILNPSWAY